jgi:hypothetical protein
MALPNDEFRRPEGVPEFYRRVVAPFAQAGYDLRPGRSLPELAWPLESERKTVLTRFGTPTVVVGGTGAEAFKFAYFHDALNIVRGKESEDDKVCAPIEGFATLVTDGDEVNNVASYSTAVALYDPVSHLITSLLHVLPSEALSVGRMIEVLQGEVIGSLAPVESMTPEVEVVDRHIHLALINADDQRLLNPLERCSHYLDRVSPTIEEIDLTDESGNRLDTLRTGTLDLLAKVFDRDDHSERNFEVSSLTYALTDDRGNELVPAKDCHLSVFTESALTPSVSHAIDALLDLGNALGQTTSEGWIDSATDAANPNRSFRDALNNIARGTDGFEVVAAVDGAVTISESFRSLSFLVTHS